jgi:TRAP-type transport system periplasmic protein
MKKLLFMTTAVLLIAISLYTSTLAQPKPAQPGKPLELAVAWFGPATHPVTEKAAIPWGKQIEKDSNGGIKINLYPGETLCPAKDTYEAVTSGIADIGIGYTGYNPGRFSLSEVLTMPFLNVTSGVLGTRVLMALYNKHAEVRAQYPGVKVIFLYTNSPAQLHSAKKPVRKLDDMKGMTVRTPGSIAPLFTAIGASPASMPASEAYEALSKGVVGATTFPWEAMKSYKISEVTKYHTELNHYVGPYYMIMNQARYDSLSPALKKAIDHAGGEAWGVHFSKVYDEMDAYGKELGKAPGHEIITLPADELAKFVAASKPVWDKWLADMQAKNLPGRAVLGSTLDLAKQLSK